MPRSKDDLRRRAAAFAAWAEYSGGQLGRAPDYMNAAVMALAAAHEHWGQNDPDLGRHAVDMYDRCRREDVCLTHTLVTPQIDRKTPLGEQEPYLNAGVVRRTENGIIVRGSRVLGTLAPFSDANVSFGLPIVTGENDRGLRARLLVACRPSRPALAVPRLLRPQPLDRGLSHLRPL